MVWCRIRKFFARASILYYTLYGTSSNWVLLLKHVYCPSVSMLTKVCYCCVFSSSLNSDHRWQTSVCDGGAVTYWQKSASWGRTNGDSLPICTYCNESLLRRGMFGTWPKRATRWRATFAQWSDWTKIKNMLRIRIQMTLKTHCERPSLNV